MSDSTDQMSQVATDRLGKVNNNKGGLEIINKNGLTAKKSLVKMSNREGSTRSLSCFKNPEMSSKELPLSEEMTLDMYHTNFESNTGLRKKSKTFSSKSTDEKIDISRLEKAKTEADDSFVNGKPMNGHPDSSSESSTTENIKLSTMLESESNDKNRNNHSRVATENLKAKSVEIAKKNPELKRTDAVDNESKVDSMVKLSSLMKHREKVAGISVQENSERTKEVPSHQTLGGQQVKQKMSNNVTQKTSESDHNSPGQYDLRSQSKTSSETHLLRPDLSQFHTTNSKDELSFESVKKIRDQFDSLGAVNDLKTKYISNSTEPPPRTKQALEMKKSPPNYEQWSENVAVSLYSKNGQMGESESKMTGGMKNLQGIRQISPQNEVQGIKVKSYHNEGNHIAIDSNFKTSDSLLVNDNLSPDEFVLAEKIHAHKNDPSLKGKVSERKEFFSSLGRLDSESVVRDWNASDRRTAKPKHSEYSEGIERDHSNRNIRGRTEANRRKINRQDMPEDMENEDSNRSLRHLYAVHSERNGKLNNSYQKNHSLRNLNENGERDYLQPKEHSYENYKNWYGDDRFEDMNGNLKTTEEENYTQIKTSRSSLRNLNGIKGDLSPASDAPSDDKDSVGEYELQPRSGRSEIPVPSDSAIQRMIEDDNGNYHIPQKSTDIPTGLSKSNTKMTSDLEYYKPSGNGFYEEINETNANTVSKDKHKLVKKPRGTGLKYGQIWYENEEDREHSDRAPTPPPMRTEVDDEYDDIDGADYTNDQLSDDEDETTIRTITKTITRQIKQTIPSGIVTVAPDGNKRKNENGRITGTITAKKNNPRQASEKNLVSGFINVEKQISQQPIRAFSRKERSIEVITKNNPNPLPLESRSLPIFDAQNFTPLTSQAFFLREGLTENSNERMLTTPHIETEIGIDPELKNAKKTGSTYKITMNLTPSLMVSSRPGSAVPNTNFISPPFSPSSFISQPNLISRHNSNTSSDTHNTLFMNGTHCITPSVFSPPAQNAPFFHSNIPLNREQERGSGSGTVVVSLTGTSGSSKQISSKSDVAFDLSLQGIEKESRAKNGSSLTVSNMKSTPRNQFSGRNIEEQVEIKTITSAAPKDVPDNSRSNWKKTENHLQMSGGTSHRSSPRKLITKEKPEERNRVQLSRSGPREIPDDGGPSLSRPEILYSALDASQTNEPQKSGRSIYDVITVSSNEQSRASQKIPKLVITNETSKLKHELDYSKGNGDVVNSGMSETTREHVLISNHKNPLKSLDEDGQFDKEIEINKSYQSTFGSANGRAKLESGGSIETWSGGRIEQINKFDLQTLLKGASTDSVKQKISIKRLGDKLSNGPQISEDLKHLLATDGLPPSENDKVAEEISMNIDNGKVTMTSEILCEKTVPIYNSQDMYKTSSVLLIRVIEVDLSVTTERMRLYDLLVGPNIEKRSLPENEKKELYKKFMALADHSRKGLL